jgi:hypothetical protein
MSSEIRVIRPFRAFHRVEALLRERAELVATDGSDPVGVGEVMFLDPSSFISAGVQLTLAPDRESLQELRDTFKEERQQVFGARENVTLVVMLSTPRLRYADIVANVSLRESSSIPQRIDLAPRLELDHTRPRALRTPRGGCFVDVLLLVDEELDKAPLKPWRKGSWLAKVRFKIRSQIHDAGFQPIPLDDALRGSLELGEGVQQYATLRDGVTSVGRAQTLDSVMEFYVDEGTLEFVSATPRGPLETHLQTRFVLDAVAFFAGEARNDSELVDYEPEAWAGTVVDDLARLASGEARPTTDDLISMVDLLRTKPHDFIARLEDAWNLRGVVAAALEDRS